MEFCRHRVIAALRQLLPEFALCANSLPDIAFRRVAGKTFPHQGCFFLHQGCFFLHEGCFILHEGCFFSPERNFFFLRRKMFFLMKKSCALMEELPFAAIPQEFLRFAQTPCTVGSFTGTQGTFALMRGSQNRVTV
jgi:hypothetical protein